ncbi:MAG: glutathione peroxidase [Desulfobulbaceae bacterium]|nr:MAG: glutathione peroxidase [Desulfobulbaceae bacterium]
MAEIYSFTVTTIDGEQQQLSTYQGSVKLIVNVASKCGFTDQYDGLEALYKKYQDQGLVIFGFPCNQFGNQEPGTEAEIKSFCRLNYGVTFPMFAKIEVNGKGTHPLYSYLKRKHPGVKKSGDISWNFTKFLIDRDGTVKQRFAPSVTPEEMEEDIKALL